jgi:hypothetical protein
MNGLDWDKGQNHLTQLYSQWLILFKIIVIKLTVA